MVLTMNKNDIKLIGIILVIIIIIFILINTNNNKGNVVEVYYDNKLILEKDFDNTYVVEGYLGEVEIEVKDRKVIVLKENSPRHICSKEGYISDSSKPLICLPNKIIIKITDKENDIDGVVY